MKIRFRCLPPRHRDRRNDGHRAAGGGARARAGRTAPAAPRGPRRQARGRGGIQPSPFATPPVRVFIYAGLKTHGEGQHDYPQFLADWSKLLMNRNAIVDGGLHFPSAKELLNSDVVIIYKGDAGYLSMEDRANLDAYMRRGGGIVSLHDALCGPTPQTSRRIVGGAKKHGETNFTLDADIAYTIVDTAHPIMQGMTNFAIKDEAFYSMTWAKLPEIHVLATAVIAATPSAKQAGHAGEIVPQIWTYEKQLTPAPDRAAVPRVRLDAGAQLLELLEPAGASRCCCAASRGPRNARPTR